MAPHLQGADGASCGEASIAQRAQQRVVVEMRVLGLDQTRGAQESAVGLEALEDMVAAEAGAAFELAAVDVALAGRAGDGLQVLD